jgi:hypothetical protein
LVGRDAVEPQRTSIDQAFISRGVMEVPRSARWEQRSLSETFNVQRSTFNEMLGAPPLV